MTYDIPKLSLTTYYVNEISFSKVTNNSYNVYVTPIKSDNEIPDPERTPIISFSYSGTANASNTSGSIVPSIQITPWEGPIPSFEVQTQYVNEFAELIVNPTEKKT